MEAEWGQDGCGVEAGWSTKFAAENFSCYSLLAPLCKLLSLRAIEGRMGRGAL